MRSFEPRPQYRNECGGDGWTSQLVEAIVDELCAQCADRLAPSLKQCERHLGQLIEEVWHDAREEPFAARGVGTRESLSSRGPGLEGHATIPGGAVRRSTAPPSERSCEKLRAFTCELQG